MGLETHQISALRDVLLPLTRLYLEVHLKSLRIALRVLQCAVALDESISLRIVKRVHNAKIVRPVYQQLLCYARTVQAIENVDIISEYVQLLAYSKLTEIVFVLCRAHMLACNALSN